MVEWFTFFSVSWVIFFLLVDYKELKTNVWGGVAAVFVQLVVDVHSIYRGYYVMHNALVSLMGSPLMFTMGPIFVVGILLSQFHPVKRHISIVYVFVLAALFSIQEYFLLVRGVLEYLNWHTTNSILVNIGAMIALSWFTIVVIDKRRRWR